MCPSHGPQAQAQTLRLSVARLVFLSDRLQGRHAPADIFPCAPQLRQLFLRPRQLLLLREQRFVDLCAAS